MPCALCSILGSDRDNVVLSLDLKKEVSEKVRSRLRRNLAKVENRSKLSFVWYPDDDEVRQFGHCPKPVFFSTRFFVTQFQHCPSSLAKHFDDLGAEVSEHSPNFEYKRMQDIR